MNTHAGYSKKTLTNTNVLLAGGGDKSLADFLGGIQYVSASHKIQYRAADTNTWSDLVTLVTTDENVKQTPKTDDVNRPLMMINGGTSAGELTSTSMFSTGIYANASTKMITAAGFIKTGSDDTYVLLGGGGHKAVSDFATSGHNHDGRYSYAHQSDWAYNVAHNSDYVTFDKSNGAGAPSTSWYNGFVSTHSNYLSSYIVNEHRTANWYVGYSENTTAPTWYKLIHSGNYTSYVNPRAVSKSMWGGTYIDASGNFQSFAGNFNMSTGDQLNMTGADWDGFAFNYASGKSGGQSTRFYNGAATEIVRFLANGNVGIGTTTPSYKLHIEGTGYYSSSLRINGPLNVYAASGRSNINMVSQTAQPNDLYFGSNGASHWSWTSRESTDPWIGLYRVRDSTWAIQILYNSNSITFGYNTYAPHYYESSDIRLKHDISMLSKSIRKFHFNNDDRLYYGFIAQELETLHPELVDSSGEYKTVNYNSAICYYIAELENKVQKLEDRLSKLEK